MKTIYLSSSAWLENRSYCETLIARLVQANSEQPDSLILDAAVVRRKQLDTTDSADVCFVEIDFRDWVTENLTEGGVIKIEAIRRSVARMSGDCIYIINAIGFDVAVIYRALAQLRIGFYTLLSWPRGLVLIGDDSQLHQVSPVLGNTFFIRPTIGSKTAKADIVRQIKIVGLSNKLFGGRVGFVINKIRGLFFRLDKLNNKKIAKERGWFYED